MSPFLIRSATSQSSSYQLSSRGLVDPVADLIHILNCGSSGYRTRIHLNYLNLFPARGRVIGNTSIASRFIELGTKLRVLLEPEYVGLYFAEKPIFSDFSGFSTGLKIFRPKTHSFPTRRAYHKKIHRP